MSTKPFATGHWLCGAVSYSINGEPVLMGHCHCKDCQRVSGAGPMSNAFFMRDDFVLSGTTGSHSVTAQSGSINTRHFCPTCGSRVYGEVSARPEWWSCPLVGLMTTRGSSPSA